MIRSRWARTACLRAAVAVTVIVIIAATAITRATPAELYVLCSNDERTCRALISAYTDAEVRVSMLRLPTSQALARLLRESDAPEFDVWIGGPAEAYVEAASAGLLEQLPTPQPSAFDDSSGHWRAIYGGVLAFCTDARIEAPTSWEALLQLDLQLRIVMPNPLTSGTAATILAVQDVRTTTHEELVDYLGALSVRVSHLSDSGTAPARRVAQGSADVAITFAPYCEQLRAEGAALQTIFPRDGTGYEVGAAGVLRNARHGEEALRFLDFVASAQGQAIAARFSGQQPIAAELDKNLSAELARVDVPVLTGDPQTTPSRRAALIALWLEQARDGEY